VKSGVGADSLSDFFKLIRVDTHIGVSPSALRNQLQNIEQLLIVFQEQCEQQIPADTTRSAVVAMNETFFGQFMILVLMDLNSGYLLLEDIHEDRNFESWYQKTAPRLKSLGIEVDHAISDRAKALIKLAVDGFDCQSGADLFHAQQDISRLLGAKLGKAAKEEAENKAKTDSEETHVADTIIHAEPETAQQAQAVYLANLRGISEDLHPFSLINKTPNTQEIVEQQLEVRAQTFQDLAQTQGIPDTKKVIQKFRNQISPLAVTVQVWWLLGRWKKIIIQ